MTDGFRLLMISAMYENGGNVVQRLLDGHAQLFSYPFESQTGTPFVRDHLSGLYPDKYRWPVFRLNGTPEEDYESIIDEECKVRIKTPQSSKFRDWPIALDDAERKEIFLRLMQGRARTRASLVEAFFRSSAEAWRDRSRSGREAVYVGYSPIIGVDAEQIVADFAGAHVLNVVRNPWSAYADTKKRPLPLTLGHYLTGWSLHLLHALAFAEKYPGRVHLVRYEDVISEPVRVLGSLLAKLGLETSPTLAQPSWNGRPLSDVRPWGTIRMPTPEANEATRNELSPAETVEIRIRAAPLLPRLGYA